VDTGADDIVMIDGMAAFMGDVGMDDDPAAGPATGGGIGTGAGIGATTAGDAAPDGTTIPGPATAGDVGMGIDPDPDSGIGTDTG
jgi:hypothetical protein